MEEKDLIEGQIVVVVVVVFVFDINKELPVWKIFSRHKS